MQSEFFDTGKTASRVVINTSKGRLGEYLQFDLLNVNNPAPLLTHGVVCFGTGLNPMHITDQSFIKECLQSDEKSCPPIVWLFGCITDRDRFLVDNVQRLSGRFPVTFEPVELEHPVLWTANQTTHRAGDAIPKSKKK